MANKKHHLERRADGVLEIELSRWRWFSDYVNSKILNMSEYVYRGQAASTWKLESKLDRLMRSLKVKPPLRASVRASHLENFKMAVRGRRGPHPPELLYDDDWWALGQHFGLATPLLDWTTSPYVAAYFAFLDPKNDGADRRAVFALQRSIVSRYCGGGTHIKGLKGTHSPPGEKPLEPDDSIRVIAPMTDENFRLVNQGGLFTHAPDGLDVEAWIRKHFKGIDKGILIKITIPSDDRPQVLKSLNRMNINHLSLFPDLYGSSKYCNVRLSIPDY